MKQLDISIGEAELEIMKAVWSHEEGISTGEIIKAVEQKGWKRTTISTFLSRLAEKGALTAEKKGNVYFYTAQISKQDYAKSKTKSLICSLFDGSVKNLAVSLFEDGDLTQGDIDELRKIFMEDKK